jgi:hypothetical protein
MSENRSNAAGFGAGALVGTLGGLIGLGGAEFRLPLLISFFRFRGCGAASSRSDWPYAGNCETDRPQSAKLVPGRRDLANCVRISRLENKGRPQ